MVKVTFLLQIFFFTMPLLERFLKIVGLLLAALGISRLTRHSESAYVSCRYFEKCLDLYLAITGAVLGMCRRPLSSPGPGY